MCQNVKYDNIFNFFLKNTYCIQNKISSVNIFSFSFGELFSLTELGPMFRDVQNMNQARKSKYPEYVPEYPGIVHSIYPGECVSSTVYSVPIFGRFVHLMELGTLILSAKEISGNKFSSALLLRNLEVLFFLMKYFSLKFHILLYSFLFSLIMPWFMLTQNRAFIIRKCQVKFHFPLIE